MKKAAAILLSAVMMLTLAACGNSSIVGTWTGEFDQITFREDGSALWAERGSAGDSFSEPDTMGYSVNGDKITFEGEDEAYTFKIEGNKLTLNFGGDSITFNKK